MKVKHLLRRLQGEDPEANVLVRVSPSADNHPVLKGAVVYPEVSVTTKCNAEHTVVIDGWPAAKTESPRSKS